MEHFVNTAKLQEFATKLHNKQKTIFASKTDVGSPLVAETIAEMTDEEKVYVYVGSESGYTAGNWYFYDGSDWVSGGVYNSAAINVDDTLTEEGAAADAKAVGDRLTPLETAMPDKANIDGAYEEMTVGNAEQLVATIFEEDSVPYNFRTSGGSADIGNRLYDEIVGGSIARNQLIQHGNFDELTGWGIGNAIASSSVSGNVLSVTSTNITVEQYNAIVYRNVNIIKGHVYLLFADYNVVQQGSATKVALYMWTSSSTVGSPSINPISLSGWNTHSYIGKASVTATAQFRVGVGSSSRGEVKLDIRNAMVIDLTQMFGTTIADYIYSLEQATAGVGVALFRSLFPKDYYAYNAGELLSVNVSAHKTVGFNAYNPTTGLAKLVGGSQYQITGTYTSVSYSDINGNAEILTIDANGYFTPTNNGTLTVVGGNSTDTCVHLVWSGYRDDEYEEYVEHTYPLDDSLTLRGIPKLDASNHLYYDGDTYEADGTVTRKYGIVDLGTLTWSMRSPSSSSEYTCFNATVTGMKAHTSAADTANGIISSKYPANSAVVVSINVDKAMARYGGGIYITDSSYSDASSFKTAMSGVYLVYELAEPTTEEADPFTNPQIVDDFGTEEYVVTEQSGVAVPVGHNTKYPANLRDKLQHLPNLVSTDGDYIIRQANRQMTLQVVPKELPTLPTEDGTYILKCTVANGAAALSWGIES